MTYLLSQEDKKNLRNIASFYGARVIFKNTYKGAFLGDSFICPTYQNNKSELYSHFFHELAHFVLYKNNKYMNYHCSERFQKIYEVYTSERKVIDYILKVEIITEKLGKDLFKNWIQDKRFKYKRTYFKDKETIKFIKDYFLI